MINNTNNIRNKPKMRRPSQRGSEQVLANTFRSTSNTQIMKTSTNISKNSGFNFSNLCVPQVRKSNLMALKRSQNLKIVASKNHKLKVLGEITQNFKNIAQNSTELRFNLDEDKNRLQARLHDLLRLTILNMTKSKASNNSIVNKISQKSNFIPGLSTNMIQTLTSKGKNLIKARLLSTAVRTSGTSQTLRSSSFSSPSRLQLSRNDEGRSSCCGGRSSNSTTRCCNTGSLCCRSSLSRETNSTSNTPDNGQKQFAAPSNSLLGFSSLELGLPQKEKGCKTDRRSSKSSNKVLRKGKNFVWNRKGKLRKIMDMFASYCDNVSLNIEDLNFPASKKLDKNQVQSLRKWLKLGFTILSRDYEQVFDQHTDNLAHAAILYSSIKVQMASSLFQKSIKPLAKRKKVSIKEVRASHSYKLFREIIESSRECD